MHKYFVKFVNFVVKNLYFQWSFAYFLYKLPRKRDIENLSLCLVFHFFFHLLFLSCFLCFEALLFGAENVRLTIWYFFSLQDL